MTVQWGWHFPTSVTAFQVYFNSPTLARTFQLQRNSLTSIGTFKLKRKLSNSMLLSVFSRLWRSNPGSVFWGFSRVEGALSGSVQVTIMGIFQVQQIFMVPKIEPREGTLSEIPKTVNTSVRSPHNGKNTEETVLLRCLGRIRWRPVFLRSPRGRHIADGVFFGSA